MQKYEVNDDEIFPCEGTQGAIAVYLASEVDARIAKLEQGLRAVIGEVNGCGPKCSPEFLRMALDSVRGIASRSL